MDKQQIKHDLEALAKAGVPDGVDVWSGVRARVARSGHAVSGHINVGRRLRRGGLGWAALVLAGLLALGATAYAASPVISKLLAMDDQLKTVDAERLGKTLDLSQTLGDVSATVQWAYADGKRVLVGYTLKTADGRRFDPAGATLTDSSGAVLHTHGGYGVVGHSDILDVTLPPGEIATIAVFESPAGAAQAGMLKLHLSLSAAEYAPPSDATPVVVNGNSAQAQPAVLLANAGPFEFDFEVPVVQAK